VSLAGPKQQHQTFAKVETIAEAAGRPLRAVKRALPALVASGWLVRIGREQGRRSVTWELSPKTIDAFSVGRFFRLPMALVRQFADCGEPLAWCERAVLAFVVYRGKFAVSAKISIGDLVKATALSRHSAISGRRGLECRGLIDVEAIRSVGGVFLAAQIKLVRLQEGVRSVEGGSAKVARGPSAKVARGVVQNRPALLTRPSNKEKPELNAASGDRGSKDPDSEGTKTTKAANRRPAGAHLTDVTSAMLKEDAALLAWARTYRRRPLSDAEEQAILGFARHAIGDGKKPVALFVKLFRDDLRANITCVQADAANRAWKELQPWYTPRPTRLEPEDRELAAELVIEDEKRRQVADLARMVEAERREQRRTKRNARAWPSHERATDT
jgi:hypothetical protein